MSSSELEQARDRLNRAIGWYGTVMCSPDADLDCCREAQSDLDRCVPALILAAKREASAAAVAEVARLQRWFECAPTFITTGMMGVVSVSQAALRGDSADDFPPLPTPPGALDAVKLEAVREFLAQDPEGPWKATDGENLPPVGAVWFGVRHRSGGSVFGPFFDAPGATQARAIANALNALAEEGP